MAWPSFTWSGRFCAKAQATVSANTKTIPIGSRYLMAQSFHEELERRRGQGSKIANYMPPHGPMACLCDAANAVLVMAMRSYVTVARARMKGKSLNVSGAINS